LQVHKGERNDQKEMHSSEVRRLNVMNLNGLITNWLNKFKVNYVKKGLRHFYFQTKWSKDLKRHKNNQNGLN